MSSSLVNVNSIEESHERDEEDDYEGGLAYEYANADIDNVDDYDQHH